jgi:CheY-like chemotaxis protein
MADADPQHLHSPGCGRRVLVAEDNDVNQMVVRELLIRLGFSCTLVSDGCQAVTHAASRTFDLVLMDCQMPIQDGFAATEAIRRGEERRGGWGRSGCRLPVIALTAGVIAGDREHCLQAGMDDYLTKPIERKHFLAVLKRWLPPNPADLCAPRGAPVIPGLADDQSITSRAGHGQEVAR